MSANVAEGCGHSSRREYARFLQMAVASTAEVENHLKLAADLRAIPRAEAERLLADAVIVRRKMPAAVAPRVIHSHGLVHPAIRYRPIRRSALSLMAAEHPEISLDVVLRLGRHHSAAWLTAHLNGRMAG